jgi:5-methylcytosine-specific restriction endonuclease McrA
MAVSARPTSIERTWRRTVDHACRNHGGRWSWPKLSLAERGLVDGCATCGRDRPLEVHHAVPVLAGGPNCRGNLLPVCGPCHRAAHEFTEGLPGFDDVLTGGRAE